jgi:uncharacterized membrane protein YeaQ/YmgE (transglycosylase-associated protein family)
MYGAIELVREEGFGVLPELFAGVAPAMASQALVKSFTIYSFSTWGNTLLGMGLGGSVLLQIFAVLLAATATGFVAGAAMYPLEVLTRRINSGKESAMSALHAMTINTMDAVRNRREPLGLRGLAKGADLTVMRETVGYSTFLSAHSLICWNFPLATSTWWGVALGGAAAGVVCFTSILPLLNIGKLLTSPEPEEEMGPDGEMVLRAAKDETLWGGGARALRSAGGASLFRGIGAMIAQAILCNSIGFSTYRQLVPTVRGWLMDSSSGFLM